MAIPPLAASPFCHHCQPLSSHSCHCQPLLTSTTPIDGWLLHPSLICRPLPTPLHAAPITDTFVTDCRAIIFLICTVLFSSAPLPLSMVVIPPTTLFNPCTPLCPSHFLVCLSLIHPGWLMHCISTRCRPLSTGASNCCLVATSYHTP